LGAALVKLPTKIRYAVRALVELADRHAADPVPVKTLAEAQGMSAKYVKQLMNKLQRAGLVRGHPGIHGGYTMSRNADDITLYDIYKAVEVSLDLVPCIGDDAAGCEREQECSARTVWLRLTDALEGTLKRTTVAELAECERSLKGRA
jgi:Rrf2 family protein